MVPIDVSMTTTGFLSAARAQLASAPAQSRAKNMRFIRSSPRGEKLPSREGLRLQDSIADRAANGNAGGRVGASIHRFALAASLRDVVSKRGREREPINQSVNGLQEPRRSRGSRRT